MPGILDFLSGSVFSGVKGIIESITAPGQAKTEAMSKLAELQATAEAKAAEYDAQLTQAQANVVMAEAKGESWLQRNWRPIFSLSLGGLLYWVVFTNVFHLPALDFSVVPAELWATIKMCVGGYVGLRSVEKVAGAYFNGKG